MIEWSESQQAIREMVKKFVEAEVAPKVRELEHADLPPYGILRKMFEAFGLRDLAQLRTQKAIARAKKREEARARGEEPPPQEVRAPTADEAAIRLIPAIELSRYCPGMVTALGVSAN